MKVTARFYGYVRDAAGVPEMELDLLEGSALNDFVDLLQSQGSAIGQLLREDERGSVPVAIVVNGRIHPKGEWSQTTLAESTVVQILPPVMGGSGQ